MTLTYMILNSNKSFFFFWGKNINIKQHYQTIFEILALFNNISFKLTSCFMQNTHESQYEKPNKLII